VIANVLTARAVGCNLTYRGERCHSGATNKILIFPWPFLNIGKIPVHNYRRGHDESWDVAVRITEFLICTPMEIACPPNFCTQGTNGGYPLDRKLG